MESCGARRPPDLHATAKRHPALRATLDTVTTYRNSPTATAASPSRDAVRDAVAVAPALLPFGATLGVVIAASATGKAAGLIGAPLVYGGSAQLTATTMFGHGAALLAVIAGATAVNARLLLYSASLANRFADQPTWFRLLGPHFIIDQTYLAASARPGYRGPLFRRYWLSLGVAVMVLWITAVGLGELIGPRLPSLPHLTLASVALFIGMLVPRLRSAPGRAAALAAAVVAPLAAQLLPGLGVIAGAAAGIVAGSLTRNGTRP